MKEPPEGIREVMVNTARSVEGRPVWDMHSERLIRREHGY